jgi:exonuclease SbcD
MRLVHLSDLHLGFRQFERTTAAGVNVREADVAASFTRAIDAMIACAPELVVIGGDVFHHSHPSNLAVVHAYAGLERLRQALPASEVVAVAGNHDTPRSSDVGSILQLFAHLGLHIVDGAARVVDLPALDCAVLAVPDNHHARPALVPSEGRRYNVLLLHGETGGIGGAWAKPGTEIPLDDVHPDAWDYVALGHYHVYREIAPRAFYSGATDYTSSDAWGELREEAARGLPGKGLIERDLDTGAQTFHSLPRSRVFVDLEPIGAMDLSATQVDDAIALLVDGVEGGIDGKVVRCTITDLPTTVKHALDHKELRQFQRRALHFKLVTTLPVHVRVGSIVHDTRGRRKPLEQVVGEFFRDRQLPAGVDRALFESLGMEYLERAVEPTTRVIRGVPAAAQELAQMIAQGGGDPYGLEDAPVPAEAVA